MRHQLKQVRFACDSCGEPAPPEYVGVNEDSPRVPQHRPDWHTLKRGRKPSQWEHYCDPCWRHYQPARAKFIQDWNDCVSRSLPLSEELAQGWYKYVGSTYQASTMGVRTTSPFTGRTFDSPGNYQAQAKKAYDSQWEMGSELKSVWHDIDAGVTKNIPQGDNGYRVTNGVSPMPPMSMTQMQEEILAKRIMEDPTVRKMTDFYHLWNALVGVVTGEPYDMEVVLMICDPYGGSCIKVECPKLILHGNTIEVDFPERLRDAIDAAGDELAELQN